MQHRTSAGRRPRSRRRSHEFAYLLISEIVIIGACIFTLLPAAWIVASSLSADTSGTSMSLLPAQLGWDSYRFILTEFPFPIWLVNSVTLSGVAAIITVAISTLAGYAFARFRFRGKMTGILSLILLQMFPAVMSLVAIFRLLAIMGLANTRLGLIIVWSGTGVAFTSWLLMGYIRSIPRDLDEAAYIDGANRWQAFRMVVLPLLRPMFAVAFLFQFIGHYNDYILASILMTGVKNYTVTVGLRSLTMQFQARWPPFAAGAVMASIPVLLVFLYAQRYLEAGLTAGSLKA